LHVQTWQKRVAANAAKRVALLGSNTTQANMTAKLQLASNIADAEVAAADQAWLNARAAAKTLADATAAARAQAEIGARASAKAAHDAAKASEAEAEAEARAASKTVDDTKAAALAVHMTNLRAEAKTKADAMALAAAEAVKETRTSTKATTDSKAMAAAARHHVKEDRLWKALGPGCYPPPPRPARPVASTSNGKSGTRWGSCFGIEGVGGGKMGVGGRKWRRAGTGLTAPYLTRRWT
jgi:hypothetical protein